MPNVDAPFGLKPVGHMTGGDVRLHEYSIASAYDTSIFSGDVVTMTGTGKNIAQAAAGETNNIGVFAGCRYVNAQGEQKFSKYWPADTVATDIVALVYDDFNLVFEAQATTLAEADVGLLMDISVGTGSAATGLSGAQIDEGTKAGPGGSFRVLEVVNRPDNAYGADAKVLVMFAEHALKGVVSGVGAD